jgi:hypothetical protein
MRSIFSVISFLYLSSFIFSSFLTLIIEGLFLKSWSRFVYFVIFSNTSSWLYLLLCLLFCSLIHYFPLFLYRFLPPLFPRLLLLLFYLAFWVECFSKALIFWTFAWGIKVLSMCTSSRKLLAKHEQKDSPLLREDPHPRKQEHWTPGPTLVRSSECPWTSPSPFRQLEGCEQLHQAGSCQDSTLHLSGHRFGIPLLCPGLLPHTLGLKTMQLSFLLEDAAIRQWWQCPSWETVVPLDSAQSTDWSIARQCSGVVNYMDFDIGLFGFKSWLWLGSMTQVSFSCEMGDSVTTFPHRERVKVNHLKY